MKVYELSREQLIVLKQNYLSAMDDSPSYGELCRADELVSDGDIYEVYDGIDFVEDDFWL